MKTTRRQPFTYHDKRPNLSKSNIHRDERKSHFTIENWKKYQDNINDRNTENTKSIIDYMN